MLVYKITNKINLKSYVGKTKYTLSERWKTHIYAANHNSNGILHKAIRKYGINNFTQEILQDNIEENVECSSIEIFYISWFNTFGGGYNLTKGGDGGVTFQWTIKHRNAQSIRMIGKNNPMYGKTHTPSAKAATGLASKKRNTGMGNPRAKKWKITDPKGNIFHVTGDIIGFAKKHDLSPWSLAEMGRRNKLMNSGSCFGWTCVIL